MSAPEQLLQQLADPSGIAWNEETYDLALASSLDGSDRASYVAKLIENAGQGDTHAILTLGHMQATEAEVEVMRVLLGSEMPALVKLGAAGRREIAPRLGTGATPQQLGIAWRPKPSEAVFDKLRGALVDTDQAFPIDDITPLTGVSRQVAETMIVRCREEYDDRVPDALLALDAAWTAPALEELANYVQTPPDLRAKLADAARQLATT